MTNVGSEPAFVFGSPLPDLPDPLRLGYDVRIGTPRCCTVYHFRPFRNSDPPLLAEIWRDQPPQRGLMQPVTAGILEQLVFSKPYFDPAGLIVAFEADTAAGFVHAGFGANDEQTGLSTEAGTTYQLMLRAAHRNDALADDLLSRAEAYLRQRGTQVIYGGGIRPLDAFYLGLYGGSELPGVLASDPVFGAACLRNGYREVDRVIVMQLDLADYRPPVTRAQRQLRRELAIHEVYAPSARCWWESCTAGDSDRLRLSLTAVGSNEPLASVDFWDIEPLATSWGVPTVGMLDLEVAATRRRQGLATFILSEAFTRLRNRGVVRIEAQTMQSNEPALALYERLGFARVDEGVVYRKQSS
jgi:GNAT superfamily N-acetyltransferase